jgi:hypothetical protein
VKKIFPAETDRKRVGAVAAPGTSQGGLPPDLVVWYDAPSVPLCAGPGLSIFFHGPDWHVMNMQPDRGRPVSWLTDPSRRSAASK